MFFARVLAVFRVFLVCFVTPAPERVQGSSLKPRGVELLWPTGPGGIDLLRPQLAERGAVGRDGF